MNLSQNPTPSKTFCDELDFGRLRDPGLTCKVVDREEKILKTQNDFLG